MPKRTRSYDSWLMEQLANPAIAATYVNTAIEDSPEALRTALRNVAEARKMAKVAVEAGVNRESLYRALSAEGNPTLNTLNAVLHAVGLRMAVVAEGQTANASPVPATPATAFEEDVMASIRTNLDLGANITTTFANFGGGNIDILVTNGAETEQQDVPKILPFFAAHQLERMETVSELHA